MMTGLGEGKISRRKLLHNWLSGSAGLAASTTMPGLLLGSGKASGQTPVSALSLPGVSNIPEQAARDEHFWRSVRALYDVPDDIIHLEHGNWGMMANTVMTTYQSALARVNRYTSYYGREQFAAEQTAILQRLADKLGVATDEIVPVRNATEALTSLITGYNKLQPGDSVLYADLDYPSMQGAMDWLAERRGVTVKKITLPEPASHENLLNTYEQAFREDPGIKLVLLTHISHRTGLLLPVKELTDMARQYGADVILDSAHAWGQIDFTVADTGVDFIGLNLHKWIGAPLGLGLMYVRRDRIADIDRHPIRGGGQAPAGGITSRVGVGTMNMAAMLSVPAALDIQELIGPKNIEARLRYLRDTWAEALRHDNRFEVLTPSDPALYAGITSFRRRGHTDVQSNTSLARQLFQEHGIFTVQRDGLASGSCVRVTPAPFTSDTEIKTLLGALLQLS